MVPGRAKENHHAWNDIVFIISRIERRFYRLDDELIFRIPELASRALEPGANLGFHLH